MNHGCQELYLHYISEVTRFLKTVESPHLHELSHNLIGYLSMRGVRVRDRSKVITHLISPFVDDWHIDIIHKDSHPAPSRRSIRIANTLVHIVLNSTLCGGYGLGGAQVWGGGQV